MVKQNTETRTPNDHRTRDDHSAECISLERARPVTSISAATLRRLIAAIGAGGPEIEFCEDVPVDELPLQLRTAVFVIVRELVRSSRTHSKGDNVLVGLTQEDERICIEVQAWGDGSRPARVPPEQSGLEELRQLVRQHGGNVTIDSQAGSGTCIVVEMPRLQETEPRTESETSLSNGACRCLGITFAGASIGEYPNKPEDRRTKAIGCTTASSRHATNPATDVRVVSQISGEPERLGTVVEAGKPSGSPAR